MVPFQMLWAQLAAGVWEPRRREGAVGLTSFLGSEQQWR